MREITLEELLEQVPKEIEKDGIRSSFVLRISVAGGYWSCYYPMIIGFTAHKDVKSAVKEVIDYFKNAKEE